ncbi:MAG: shikimate dehydrogenase [Clostridia bacterium]|nr:shikimate dehydrogenase [Clostridia bacterium]
MIYGCIGEHLGHSFSKEIHAALATYKYEICEIERDKLASFMEMRDFSAINVTIPYKEAVIPHLYYISESAKAIGAVNTIVNRNGKLYGYNTDHYGMSALINRMGLELSDKKVAVLGTGGTSKTAVRVALDMGAGEVIRTSRSGKDGALTYEELYAKHSDVQIIINTTPSGMYPHPEGMPIELEKLPKVCGVVDAVYNPLRTRLVNEARKRGIKAEGGLYMLVAQAVRASEIFLDTKYSPEETERVYRKVLSEKENIVLVGMPASGKTTVGTLLSKILGRRLIDTDAEIVKEEKVEITQIFEQIGESGFRDIEERIIRNNILSLSSSIIATGGGAVLRDSNIDALKQNGKLYFLDRPLEKLIPTEDRPLASTAEAIKKRYNERYKRYCAVCDTRICGDLTPEESAEIIIKEHTT